MDDHRRVAGQGTEAVLQQVGQLVLLVGQVLLAVEDGQQDVAHAREGDPTAGLSSFGVPQVDQMQTAPAAGDCGTIFQISKKLDGEWRGNKFPGGRDRARRR